MTATQIIEPKDKIKADLASRENQMNGLYGVLIVPNLSKSLWGENGNDMFFLKALKARADLADKIIAEAESKGVKLNDPEAVALLKERINASGDPITRKEWLLMVTGTSLRVIAFYVFAVGIWGLVFGRSVLFFGFCGSLIGLVVCLLLIVPAATGYAFRNRLQDFLFGGSILWDGTAIGIGLLGLVAWLVKLVLH